MNIVIMAGGQGTRFWPWSTTSKPKQFLPLMSDETMLQQTYNRFNKWIPAEKIYIVTTKEYVPIVTEQLPSIHKNQIIVEPMPKDTGPCIALTALRFLQNGIDEAFAAVPSDHFIPEDIALKQLFLLAENITSKEDAIVTFGIKPSRPETGYGYIEVEEETVTSVTSNSFIRVKRFIEKPDHEKAEQLFKEKNVYWNSGIFIWKPSTISYYMKKFQPNIWNILSSEKEDLTTQYSLVPKISVDYAILERADVIYTIPTNLVWDDVGSWNAWERLNVQSNNNNLIRGDVHLVSTENCVINSDDKKAVVIGVQDLIIASTNDGLLICHKSQEHKIKEVLQTINNRKQ